MPPLRKGTGRGPSPGGESIIDALTTPHLGSLRMCVMESDLNAYLLPIWVMKVLQSPRAGSGTCSCTE